MKYWVRIGAETVEVEVTAEGVLLVDGRPVKASLLGEDGQGVFSFELDDGRYLVAAERVESRWTLTHAGETAGVEVETKRSRRLEAARRSGSRGKGNGTVKAPMPGLVLRLDVKPGDRVESGAGLLVLEAMKMENLIRAPINGVVSRIAVSEGKAVEKGALLVEVDPS